MCTMADEDTTVTIGLEQGFYSAREDCGLIQICVGVVSGVVNGRNISVDYMTIDGSAEGSLLHYLQ